MLRARARTCVLAALLASATLTSPLPADPTTGKQAATRKLPELPTPPGIEPARPEASDLAELDALLGRIIGSEAADRETATRELLEVQAKHVAAIRFRVGSLADGADKEAMKRLLLKTRRVALEQRQNEPDSEKADKAAEGVDYLGRLVAEAEPKSEAWRNLVSLLALSRMLESVGSVEAVRGLIEIYARYGEFMRIPTQRALTRLGDKAVPALIEAERHPAEKISKWAVRQLDMLGKGVPSEAVGTQDQAVLADVLRAYGRTRNPDALRIVASFANSERAQIREAARQAVALMGEVGTWQLRDTYENVVGKKPPRDWSWERTARELFAEFDRLRFAEVGKLFEQGEAARARGDLTEMKKSYDALLARAPSFEQKSELAQGYLAFAQAHADKAAPDALAALRRAERLDPTLAAASSLRLTLEAEALEERGVADVSLLRRALELDAQNRRAEALLARFERGEPKRSEKARYAAAASILGLAALAIAFILLRRSSTPTSTLEPLPPAPETVAPETETAAPEPDAQKPQDPKSEPEASSD